jgi:NADPH:quinone reductase-like Zn-dependent oxidoreductase
MTSTETIPAQATMHAIAVGSWGGPDVLEEVTLPRPEPGPTEILVAVHAAGVNATDWKARATGGFDLWSDPVVLGYDVSGVVEAVGPGASLFEPGDKVFGMPRFPEQAGAYAEYVAAPSHHFARRPVGIDHIQAAALPLVGLTAWQALTEVGRVEAGQRVLIHAAAGGLGHVAVQIAKALGAHVIGTASAAKHDFLRSLGADELIDHTEVDFAEAVTGVDVVLDAIGGDYARRSLRTLRSGGSLISLTSPDEPDAETVAAARERGINTGFTLVEPDRAGMLAIAELVEAGKLHVEIADVLPLSEARRAHELGETGRTTGKLVLRVRD